MKTEVKTLKGKKEKEIELPTLFTETYRPKTIRRAVVSAQTKRYQPKGNKRDAGMDTSAEYIGRRRAYRSGINRGIARLPRGKPGGGGIGKVRIVPHAVGGRRAHPPKTEKKIRKEINKKEENAGIRSAISASSNPDMVKQRGHKIDSELPIIVTDEIEDINKTKKAKKVLEELGIGKDLEKAKRNGSKTALIIVSEGKARGFKNLPGVEVSKVEDLNAEKLAPGAQPGRVTIWSESAAEKAEEEYGA